MSITSGFEESKNALTRTYPDFRVDALLAHTRALEAMLKKHEWTKPYAPTCSECGMYESQGHAPNCQLAKLLEGV